MKQTMRKKKSRTGSKAYIILAGVEKRVNGQSSVDEMQQSLFDFHKNEIPKYEFDNKTNKG